MSKTGMFLSVGWMRFLTIVAKALTKQTADGIKVHSFQSLIGDLKFGGGGALRGSDDGGAGSLCLPLVIIVEEDRSQELAHMPFHVIGQHAKQDVGADTIG